MTDNYAFINCNIIDGNLQSEIQKDMTILVNSNLKNGVKQGIIHKIANKNEIEVPPNYKVIDLQNRYVMPGLINAHIHSFGTGKPMKAVENERRQKLLFKLLNTKPGRNVFKRVMKKNYINGLNSGVTTMRCVGDFFYLDVKLRNEIDNGNFLGPRLMVSGPMISVTGGHGGASLAIISDSPWEGRKCVRKNVREEVDLIKICVTGGIADSRKVGEAGRLQMTTEEVTAICDEAHKIGMMVAAHVESKEGMRVALMGGVDTIEHGAEMDDEIISLFKNNPKSLRGYSALIPTMHPPVSFSMLDTSITGISEVAKENTIIVYREMVQGIKQALEAGIKIGLGTDASMSYITHYNTWRELDYLVRYIGITPKQAIYHATKSNAEILGIDDETGSLEIGKSADFIVLNENPLENLRSLSEPKMVIIRGTIINEPNIDKIPQIDEALDQI
ncbi:Imidazolonepropionase [Clostridium cavendishii DSM 21758]|uniref:Imidazolonepropionase n=1 Tax=Clostridium cavendishii DSM 21758 TaxID=1121302 RepID=A0A1M6HJV0_9CLOT|nr:amidohydrolase family protein [Clostridium cavendishii]SHJ22432.1 Imidazolonepropionase [Clostridium cavendishii DSM 21758]